MVKDFKDIREFIVLAEICNYQEASERLYISPSTLSKHIMALEETLGVHLFDRTTRSVTLTKYGKTFYKYAQEMVHIYDECSNELNELRVDSDHRICVGFLSRLEQCGIIEVLTDFPAHYQGITLDMAASNTPLDLLKEQKCQFVFDSDNYPKDSEIESILYKKDSLVAVLPLDHPFANMEGLKLEQLRNERFIIHSDAAAIEGGVDIMKLCENAGFKPEVSMSASYTSTIVKLVRQGQGVSVLNRMNVPATILSTVAVVPIQPEVPYYIYLLYLKKAKRTPAFNRFLDYIKNLKD